MTLSLQKVFNFTSGEISPRLYGNSNVSKYQTALASSNNLLVGLYGFLTARPGTKFVRAAKDADTTSFIYKFKYSNTQSYILEFSSGKIRFYKDQAVILNTGVPYEVTIPYSDAECEHLEFAPSFDTVYITHPSYLPRKLVRFADNNWTISIVPFDEPAYLDINETAITLTPNATTGTGVTLTASSALFAATDVGRAVRYLSGAEDIESFVYDNPGSSQIYFNIPFFPKDSTNVEVIRQETTGENVTLTYNASTLGADDFKIADSQVLIHSALSTGETLTVKRKNTSSGVWGWATITGYTSTTVVTITINSTFSGTNASTLWRLGAWSETTGYPKLCTFHNQRLWFANNLHDPAAMWASAIQDFENFAPDNDLKKGQVDGKTSISVSVSDIIAIAWMKPTTTLLIGGEGIRSINKGGGVITAENIYVLPEEATNCSEVKPIVTANEVIFADYQNKSIKTAGYSFQSNAFVTTDLNLLTDHLFETYTIKQIAFQETPIPTVWVLRSNGTLVSCTYDKLQEISAWTQHTIGGSNTIVESIEVIPYNNSTELWMTVSRTIDEDTVRYIEVLTQPFFNDEKETCVFLDSALQYDGAAADTITGLGHLEGETVGIMADGAWHEDKVVTSGEVNLNYEATNVTIGLKYDIEGETVPLDTGKQNGAAIGSKSRVNEAYMNFFETDGCFVGFDSINTQEILFRPPGLTGGEAYPVYTGIKKILLNSRHEDYYKVYFKQPYPLPFTIRNITYRVDITNN
jgi:hypothetical protein